MIRALASCSFALLAGAHPMAQVSWLPQTQLTPRSGHAMAWDAVGKQVVVFAGTPGDDDLWGWSGATWTELPAAARPPGRSGHAMAFDAQRGRLVVFGGRSTTGYLGDTWEWNGTTWQQLQPTTQPPARADARMVFDSARGRVVLFGGGVQGQQLAVYSDLWEWDGRSWTQSTATGPAGRAEHAMAYDPIRRRVVVRGGWNGGSPDLTDTWEYDGVRWTQRQTATQPAVHRGAAAWFDPAAQATMLVGYLDFPRQPIPPRQETWALDATGWRLVHSTTAGPQFLTVAHDPIRGRAVRLDMTGEVHEFDGNQWTPVQGAQAPGAGWNRTQAMAFDQKRAVTILVVSNGNAVETWQHDGRRWTLRPAVGGPVIQRGHAVAFDTARDRLVLFGGDSPYGNDQTWEYDGTSWARLLPTVRPPRLDDPAMVYDPVRGRVVLVGATYSGVPGSTWTWDGTNWKRENPTTAPWGRVHARAVWHPGRRTVVLYAGGDPDYTNTVLGDLWEWNGTTWAPIASSVPPGSRSLHQMAYDAARDRLVVYGGRRVNTWLTDTWEWGPAGWTQRLTTRDPGRSSQLAMSYDAARRRTLLAGGESIAGWTYGPDVPATATPYGSGCLGSAGTPALAGENLPWLGDPFRQVVTNLVAQAPGILVVGASNQAWGSVPLPLDLKILAMPGCSLLASYDVTVPLGADASGIARFTYPIPTAANLLGATAYTQAFAVDRQANAQGITNSGGLAMRMGGR